MTKGHMNVVLNLVNSPFNPGRLLKTKSNYIASMWCQPPKERLAQVAGFSSVALVCFKRRFNDSFRV